MVCQHNSDLHCNHLFGRLNESVDPGLELDVRRGRRRVRLSRRLLWKKKERRWLKLMKIWLDLAKNTGLGKKVVPRLHECCRQNHAGVISKGSKQIHQTWGPLSSLALYSKGIRIHWSKPWPSGMIEVTPEPISGTTGSVSIWIHCTVNSNKKFTRFLFPRFTNCAFPLF